MTRPYEQTETKALEVRAVAAEAHLAQLESQLAKARAQIAAALAVHHDDGIGLCHGCPRGDARLVWPCPTARALTGETP